MCKNQEVKLVLSSFKSKHKHRHRFSYMCPGLPLEKAKCSGQWSQRSLPQQCQFITSACLAFPLESQFPPLRRRGRWGRKEGGGGGDSGVIRHRHWPSPVPAGQNAAREYMGQRWERGGMVTDSQWDQSRKKVRET